MCTLRVNNPDPWDFDLHMDKNWIGDSQTKRWLRAFNIGSGRSTYYKTPLVTWLLRFAPALTYSLKCLSCTPTSARVSTRQSERPARMTLSDTASMTSTTGRFVWSRKHDHFAVFMCEYWRIQWVTLNKLIVANPSRNKHSTAYWSFQRILKIQLLL